VETTRAGLTPGPRTAVIWAALRAELDRRPGEPLSVIDVGGGTGGFAVPLAQSGHRVTVIDASPDALASLRRRAVDAGVADLVSGVQGDGDQLAALVAPQSADLVLCHSVLEEVDDPAQVLASIAAILRAGGAASIVVANRRGAILAKALAGHIAAAVDLFADESGVAGGAAGGIGGSAGNGTGAAAGGGAGGGGKSQRRFDTESATALIVAAGFDVESVHGVRVIADIVPGTLVDSDAHALLNFELVAAGHPPFRDIATQLHLLARRTG
jgi:S-adenosylmethionine-dependent methyltransferase